MQSNTNISDRTESYCLSGFGERYDVQYDECLCCRAVSQAVTMCVYCLVCHFRHSFNCVKDSSLFVLLFFLGNKATVDFGFKEYSDKAEILKAVADVPYRREHTNMTGGFKVMRQEVFGQGYEERANVVRLIVLITDGEPTWDADKLQDEVAAIKNMGIRVIGLGVTKKVCLFNIHSKLCVSKTSTANC